MSMMEVFKGKSKDPFRTESGTVATGYAIGNLGIDAPEGVSYPNASLILLTHEHCDHIAGLSLSNTPYAASPFAADAISKGNERAILCAHLGITPPRREAAHQLKDGQVIKGKEFSLEVIFTPGHSEGSACFYMSEEKALFSGDTVFGDGYLPSFTLPTSEPQSLVDSYERLSSYEVEKICPGHGLPFSEKKYIEKVLGKLRELIQP